MELGDVVKITDEGQIYSTYNKMADIMNLPHWKSGTCGSKFKDHPFVIVGVYGSRTCYGIDNGITSLVVNKAGLQVVCEVKIFLNKIKTWGELNEKDRV